MHRKVPAGFGGRLRGKGPHPPLRARDLAAQPIRLQERDSRDLAADPPPAAGGEPADSPRGPAPGDSPRGSEPDGGSGGSEPDGGSDGPGENRGPGGPGGAGDGPGGPGPGAAPGRGPASGPSLAALVTLTIPLATWQRRAEAPGEADGFGPLDGDDARDLAAAAARHPRTRWCLTALNPDGTAAAHGCLPGRHPPPGLARPAAVSDPNPPGTGPPLSPPGPDIPDIPDVPLIPVARGPCDHARAETGYHPSRKLAHLIRARNGRCTAPGCTRPAARCDLDHTRPWDQSGPTCECNLAPRCKR